MKISISISESICTPVSLAREIGLAEAQVLITMIRETVSCSVEKDGIKQIACDTKRLKSLFSWCKIGVIKNILESLRQRNLIYIDSGLFDDSQWYALNYDGLKTLKSLTVISENEDKEYHPATIHEAISTVKSNGNSRANASRISQVLFGAFIRACGFDPELLQPRDKGEVGNAVKELIRRYPDHEIDALKLMIEGARVWWTDIDGARYRDRRTPPRPGTILSNWQKYVDYCKESNSGKPPELRLK